MNSAVLSKEVLNQRFDIGDLSHLIDDAEIQVLTGPQAQGDVSWYPTDKKAQDAKEIPQGGLVIMEGLNNHPHTLFAQDGPVMFSRNPDKSAVYLGTAVVPKGSTLVVGHNEHGFSAVGEGTYIFNGAREQANEIRRLAD